jgi:ribosomal protein S10
MKRYEVLSVIRLLSLMKEEADDYEKRVIDRVILLYTDSVAEQLRKATDDHSSLSIPRDPGGHIIAPR